MKELYSHKVLTSFYLWFDHNLLNNAQAFHNESTLLYSQDDHRVPNMLVPFASPFKQWVYDSSIAGAQVPTGIYIDGVFTPKSSDVVLDYDNGRVLLNGVAAPTVSGNYSAKDFNTYIVSNEDSKMIFEGNFNPVSPTQMVPQTGVNAIGYTAPACFIMNTSTDSKPFAFGGEQETINKMRVIVVTDDIYKLDGCVSMFRDLANSIIPLVSVKDAPFDEYGDLKSGSFNYANLAAANSSRYLYIDKVSATKITNNQQSKNNPTLRYGIIDFYLSEPRVPKLDL